MSTKSLKYLTIELSTTYNIICNMTPDTLPKRIFFCLVIIVLVFGICGCQSIKHEWLPGDQPLKAPTRDREAGGGEVDVIDFKF